MEGLSNDPLRGLLKDRRNGPQAIRDIVPNGTSVEWQEGGETVKAQIWTEHANDHRVWLAVYRGDFPGEMRLARYAKGRIMGVDPTVYNCRGRQFHSAATNLHNGASTEAECTQGALFDAPAPEPPPLETLPLF